MALVHGQDIGGGEIEREASSWDAVRFARLCNAIAWASTWREAQALPAFTERVIVADNGIDAEWQGDLGAGKEGEGLFLRAGLNVFQYKKREVATLRRQTIVSGLCSELRGAARDVESRAKKTLSAYVVFTNIDLTTAQHDALRAAILEGIADERVYVGVVGAADLAAMLNQLPHVRSAFFATAAFRTWGESWRAHQQVSAFAQTDLVGREDSVATIRAWMDDPEVRVIALSGVHMMGKTRVALEATRSHDVSFVEALDRQTLNIDDLYRLVSPGRVTFTLVNDPDRKLAEELAKETLGTDGLKLILSLSTADAAPAPSFGLDTRVRSLSLPVLNDQKSEALLKAAGGELDFSLVSWVVENAGGVPGILLAAAKVGAGLRRGGGSFLDQVARGFEQRTEAQLTDAEQQALRALSLMSHMGIEGQAEAEAQIICENFGVELNTLLDSVEALRAAGFIRVDGSYAEVVPPPLANRLAGRMMRGCLRSVCKCFSTLEDAGRRRLLRRLLQLHGEEAQRFWNGLLGENGPLTTLDGIVENSGLFRFAAAGNGAQAGPLLRRLLQQASVDERLTIVDRERRDLFYACEELLFRESSSADGLECLALLAEAENETWGNNSSGVFKEAVNPLHPQMPLPLVRRLEILQALIARTGSETFGRLAVEAAAGALEPYFSAMMRHSGSAVPLGQRPELTWPQVWDYEQSCLELLVEASGDKRESIKIAAGRALPRAVTIFISRGHHDRGMPYLRTIVGRVLVGDPTFDASELAGSISLCRHWLRDDQHGGAENNAATLRELDELLSQLRSADFFTRMRLWVGGWSLDIESKDDPAATGQRAIASLAKEVSSEPELLTPEIIAWLCGGEAKQAGPFWHELGRHDVHRKFEATIRALGKRDEGAHGFMLYSVGWCEREAEAGRKFFNDVAEDEGTSPNAILLGALHVDLPDVGAGRLVNLMNEGKVKAAGAIGGLQAARWLREVSETGLVSVLELVAGPDLEDSGQILELLDLRLHDRVLEEGPLADFAWRCLEAHPVLARYMGDYYSDHLARRLARLNPDRGFALLARCMVDERPGSRWNPITTGPNHLALWQELSRYDRLRALSTVLEAARREPRVLWRVQFWLYALVDMVADADFLVEYAAGGESEALIACEAVTGGRSGFWPIACRLIELYPASTDLKAVLEQRVMQSGQVVKGPYSDHYRGCLADVEQARRLPEVSPAVVAWLEDFAIRLQQGLEWQLRREADERVNQG